MDTQESYPSSSAGQYGRMEPSTATSMATTPTQRPGTPEGSSGGSNSFGDRIGSQVSRAGTNPFTSPEMSRPTSSYGSASALDSQQTSGGQRYFHSRRVRKGEIEKLWLEKSNKKERWITFIPLIGIFLGLCLAGFLVCDGLSSVVKHNYCLLMEDDFSGGFNTDIWFKEVQLGGFGNGEFEETTGDDSNVFIQDGHLMIQAKLQNEQYMTTDTIIDLLKDGTCTSTQFSDCVAATNTSNGNSSVVPPALSGRINTMKSTSIKYGRVEVTAKMPKGDWLWPAIWMLPVNNTYGPWPASGEIDIAESRGNNHTYGQGGNNIMSSALHWGPLPTLDGYWRTNNKFAALHTTYADGFNTFGMEWSNKYLFTFVNSRLLQVMYVNFNQPLWNRGDFPSQTTNGTLVIDPWTETGLDNTPFDQPFYLILNLAVGGTNGWFPDNQDDKPWLDASPNAKKDFWETRAQWYPSWTQPQLEVSKVSMYTQCGGGSSDL